MNDATGLKQNADVRTMQHPSDIRRAIRSGLYDDRTGGLAPGYVQANLCILPADYANDFLRYCQRNPKSCPLLAVSETGDPALPGWGDDLDVRTDVGRYDVFLHGEQQESVTDIRSLWQKNFVTFALGCSYSFEQVLLDAGLRLKHLEQGIRPARYNTNIETLRAGPFHGRMVVTMRPFRPADAIRAILATSRFPLVHGAPVHIGLPHLIGIEDMQAQCETRLIALEDDEIPLFWGCGVTPQLAIENARPPICITHTPGCMLITDRLNASLAAF